MFNEVYIKEIYLSNKEKIAKNLSKGILQYFRVEKQEK